MLPGRYDVTVSGTGTDIHLDAPDTHIPLPTRLQGVIGPTVDKKFIAGFRPDHLELGDLGSSAATIKGRADVVEYLGAQELLHVSAAGKDLVAIVNASNAVRPGDDITLSLPLDKLHLFDAESGISITEYVRAGKPVAI